MGEGIDRMKSLEIYLNQWISKRLSSNHKNQPLGRLLGNRRLFSA